MKQAKKVMTTTLLAFAVIITVAYAFTCQAQNSAKPNAGMVTISLKNNSILPQKITLISYQPGETGNGTRGFVLMPFASRKYSFTQGTKIYLAKQSQVDTVMSGGRLNDEPFLVIKQEDDGKSFKILK